MLKKVIIIGAGTYGSYLAHCLSEKYPNLNIELFDVGDEHIQSEKEIGFLSVLKNGVYNAATSGRFFGLGGTSAKWGGQMLFFSENDFGNAPQMQAIVDSNVKYKARVLSRFFKKVPQLNEKEFKPGLFTKQGVWLKFQQRNIFTHFNLKSRANITIHKGARIIALNAVDGTLNSITVQFKDQTEPVLWQADQYYLTTGAFESLRLMHVSGILDMAESAAGFSDHVSYRCFKIETNKATVGTQDFQFRFANGSMITSRLVGEIDDTSFYVHPVFNEEFNFFQFLKQLIFKGNFSVKQLLLTGKQVIYIIPFIFSYLFQKKLYIYKNWFLLIDIELSKSANTVCLSQDTDGYGQAGIAIDYGITNDTIEKLLQIKANIKQVLDEAGVKYTAVDNSAASSLKLEDIYHPYRLFSYKSGKTIGDIYRPLNNLYMFNTGMLYRSGGINPTAALFCFIEQHLDEEQGSVG